VPGAPVAGNDLKDDEVCQEVESPRQFLAAGFLNPKDDQQI